ncbi:hypothetical protein [Rhizobium sp. SGZ-381]|uniref:hypothetical protein n=1 Tax=Rhizobium sp. SGZ-381 TaxID=3342800 RepID=UPI00366AF860
MSSTTPLFRVHFGDGTTVDIPAETADAARKSARPRAQARETVITKVKLVRETR